MDAFFRLAPLDEWRDVELNSPLDDLYLNGDKEVLRQTLKEFKKNGGLKGFRLASHESIGEVMEEIAGLENGQISPTLFESYSENLRKAVSQVFKRDSGNGLSDQLRANVSKFAAYKAYEATTNVRSELGNDLDKAERILRTYNRTQATEYNTTISRSRTAKQFEKFESSGLFPNLRWLPSRSADPRESHMLFWDRVWAKDDPFWNENTPGSLWNCKCDWEETDDPVTEDNPGGNRSARGLKGNPAATGEVFSDDHPYFSSGIPDNTIRGVLRKESKNLTQEHAGKNVTLDLPGIGKTKVIFDGKSKNHIINDSSEGKDFLIPQIAKGIFNYAKSARCVATAPNMKPEKKKWSVKYFYLECLIGGNKYYLDIEEVNNTAEGRHFFRFYSITKDLSDNAIMI